MANYEFLAENINVREDNFYYLPIVKMKLENRGREVNNVKEIVKEKQFTSPFLQEHKNKAQTFSGILKENEMEDYLRKLPNYSFILHYKIKLTTPYFSRDEEVFSIVSNPILKDTAFKVPMIRGSSWKGALRHSGLEIIKECNDLEGVKSYLKSLLRIFGSGNDTFRAIFSGNFERGGNEILRKVKLFLALEVGINPKEEITTAFYNYLKREWRRANPHLFISGKEAQKGRAIFYPTFFDKLSFEILNPHDRRTRAGTIPINYEVVPKGTGGVLQIVYIPFDGILKPVRELEEEVRQDLEFLQMCVEKTAQTGIGAKSKMWGRFEVVEKIERVKKNNEILNSDQFLRVEGGTR
jgi:CRISPR-associated protein Cmr2